MVDVVRDARWNNAVKFAATAVMRSSDWQEVQHELANSSPHAEYISEIAVDDEDWCDISVSIIREAEESLGRRIPSGYSN
jgi:hypothetical protein